MRRIGKIAVVKLDFVGETFRYLRFPVDNDTVLAQRFIPMITSMMRGIYIGV